MSEHHCAGILFRDERGRILMQFRDAKATSDALAFSFFGGAAMDGETDLETMLRETHEELGVRLRPEDVHPVGTLHWPDPHTGHQVHVTLFESLRSLQWGEFVVNEGEGAAFLSPDEILRLPFVSSIAKAFTKEFLA